jgi:HAD superfamily hydrolase (TIGR01509 family)
MAIKGVIFDFNGTLFWDTPFHNTAWDRFLENHQIELTDQEKNERIHGKNNRDIFTGLFNRPIEPDELERFIDEKEQLYRDICVKEQQPLADGAIELFEFLKENQIRYTIATASGPENVHFFFEQFKLHKWFDFEQVVYDDGTLRGKPNPDFFLKAMEKLNLQPAECLIFEDSIAGIQAAENAGAGKIIIVNSTQANYGMFGHEVIRNFRGPIKSWFTST